MPLPATSQLQGVAMAARQRSDGASRPVRMQVAEVRSIVDEIERSFIQSQLEQALPSGLCDQLAEELELLARALRRNDPETGFAGAASIVQNDRR